MIKYTVYATSEEFTASPIFADELLLRQLETDDENRAINMARSLGAQHDYVYIYFSRDSDGQTGYLNRDGYGFDVENWSETHK